MKKVITGWIGRSETINSCIGRYESECSFDIEMSKVKGRKSEWHAKDWPPVKVTITVETAE